MGVVVQSSDNSQRCENKSQESTSHIPHEQAWSGKVENKETKSSCYDCIAYDIHKDASLAVTEYTEKKAVNDCRSRCHTVQTVHEVVGIG